MNNLIAWLKRFIPGPVMVSRKEQIFGGAGACAGLMFAILLSEASLDRSGLWFIAPMGASAVLLFAVPSSPLAQPWSIIGGNIVSALIGVTCAKLFGVSAVSAGVAVAGAIGAMFALRCLHPPSGAVALMGVMGGPQLLSLGYSFVLWPVAINSLFLLMAALLINYALQRRYPHHHVEPVKAHKTADPAPEERMGLTRADLDKALEEYSALLDVYEEDLEQILQRAEFHAFRRRSGDIRCKEVMSRDVIKAAPNMTIDAALKLMTSHKVGALPVTDGKGELMGMVTLAGVAAAYAGGAAAGSIHVDGVLDQGTAIARLNQSLLDLPPLFSDSGQHTIPVLDETDRVVGVITHSDLIAALYRARIEEEVLAVGEVRRVGNA